ncbi:hypothetical protein FRC17_007776 [Serendipita sp. 399]|nr:hypothetical protein FRC17_007776 [Serendipita sp. 399]
MCTTLKRQIVETEGAQKHSTPKGVALPVVDVPLNVGPPTTKDRINGLPTELLVTIFKFDVESQHVSRNATLVLVCKRWKEVVDALPRLWSRIRLAPHSSIDNLISCTEIVKFCTKMSYNVPLDISLDLSQLWDPADEPLGAIRSYIFEYEEDNNDYVFDELMQSIVDRSTASLRSYIDNLIDAMIGNEEDNELHVSHMERWERFQLEFSGWMDEEFASAILARFSAGVPILKTLDVTQTSYWGDSPSSSIIENALLHCSLLSGPNLAEFTTNFAIGPSQFLFGRNSIRSFTFAVTPASFSPLSGYHGIRTLHLIVDGQQIYDQEHLKPGIFLPNLSTLILSRSAQRGILLSLIEAPNLQCLRLSGFALSNCPDSRLFGCIKQLEWDCYFSDFEGDKHRTALMHIFKQCTHLVHFLTWGPFNIQTNYSITHLIEEILREAPLTSLESITYLRPYAPNFDSGPIQRVITMPFM